MSKTRKPELPPAVQARVAKHVIILVDLEEGEGALDRFLNAVRADKIPERDDLRIVAACLTRVLGGASFGRAFNLQKGQGRRRSRSIDFRDQCICGEIKELRREGYTLEDAADLVARRYSVSPETVSKLHKAKNKADREIDARTQRAAVQGRN